jgi:hypothetical protein
MLIRLALLIVVGRGCFVEGDCLPVGVTTLEYSLTKDLIKEK